MKPDEVYVVYDQSDDTLHSVHSFREFAVLERDRLIVAHTQAGMPSPFMRYVICTLDEAVEWMYAPDNSDARIYGKFQLHQ